MKRSTITGTLFLLGLVLACGVEDGIKSGTSPAACAGWAALSVALMIAALWVQEKAHTGSRNPKTTQHTERRIRRGKTVLPPAV